MTSQKERTESRPKTRLVNTPGSSRQPAFRRCGGTRKSVQRPTDLATAALSESATTPKHVDKSLITVGSDGKVTGADKAIDALIESYLHHSAIE